MLPSTSARITRSLTDSMDMIIFIHHHHHRKSTSLVWPHLNSVFHCWTCNLMDRGNVFLDHLQRFSLNLKEPDHPWYESLPTGRLLLVLWILYTHTHARAHTHTHTHKHTHKHIHTQTHTHTHTKNTHTNTYTHH